MEHSIVDKSKLITQSEYAKMKGLTRQRINQLVKTKELNIISIKGAKLILLP